MMPDPRLGVGGNKPPSAAELLRQDLETATEALRVRRDELLAAVERVPAITNDEISGMVADQLVQLRTAIKAAENAHEGAKAPHLEAGRLVDGAYIHAIVAPLTAAGKALKERNKVYLDAKAAAELKRREEAERKARAEADRLAKEAAAAQRAAIQAKASIDDAVAASERSRLANEAAERAKKAAEAKPAEMSRVHGQYGGVQSLRKFWDYRNLDRAALDLNALRNILQADALDRAIRDYIKAGGRKLDGVEIFENTR